MMSLTGRHAIVTGGGTGIGAAIARTLAASGVNVSVLGRRDGPLAEVAAAHPNIAPFVCDVTNAAEVAAAVARAAERFGTANILIANAGSAESKPIASMDGAHVQRMLDVNFMGTFNLWHAGLPALRKAGSGRLIAIASVAGLKGYPYVAAYTAAKHAVIGLTRSFALELAESGITVNAVCPGFVETPMLDASISNIVAKTGRSKDDAQRALTSGNPQRRVIQPEEVASAVLWLCSDGARSVNGHTLTISGGEI
ncbi:MAG: hypothetical protein RL291_327 [Pseudomonadota bacterium]